MPRVTAICGFAFCLLSACASLPSRPEYAGGTRTADMTSVSRVVMPVDGGQTIPVPRLMGDAYALWSPPGKGKGRVALSAKRSVPLPDRQRLEGNTSFSLFAGKLSSDQRETAERYLYRLTQDRRSLTQRVFIRAEQHLPNILAVLGRKGLPAELAALPMVESAFESEAVSSAGAAGLWQLMPDTARRFGLRVDKELDERFDPGKATEAATDYLAVLYDYFGDWPLAVAAYNCGEGAMRRALSQTDCNSLAELSEQCRLAPQQSPLTEETLDFVPAFAAAMTAMSKSRELGLYSAVLLPSTPQAVPFHAAQAISSRSPVRVTAKDRQEQPLSPQRGTGELQLIGDYTPQSQPEVRPPQSLRLPESP